MTVLENREDDLARENAELRRQLAEAQAQQDAVGEVLQVINSSPGDLTPVFDAILEKAMALCGAAFGTMGIAEEDAIRTVTTRGVPPAFAEFGRRNIHPGGPGSIVARLLRGETVHLVDAKDDEIYRRGDPSRRAMVDLGGARSVLAVALRNDANVLGAMGIYRQEVRPFTDKEIALLQNFAAQAVIAMENARLLTETREALEQQTATAEILQVINASPGDLAPVFERMIERAMRLCEAEFGELLTFDGERFSTVATRGVPAAYAERRGQGRLNREPGSFGSQVLEGAQIIHVADLKDTDLYRVGNQRRHDLVDLGGVRTALAVSLSKDDEVLGFIIMFRGEVRLFSDQQIALLQNFAAQAVIAMENARLLGELRQRTDEIAQINRDLEMRVAEQVDELGRVGRLKRFLAPQLAEMIVSRGDDNILESHRREIVVVFCDLRGFTAFAETAEPEEVLDFLREYHAALGPLVARYEGTLDHFSGDGIMVFFNDPVLCPDPAERAVAMAVAMRAAAGALITAWRRRGRELGFGAGIAQGYATLGQIGFADRSDYTAIGTVCNLASRLCAEAKDAQILVSQRIAAALDGSSSGIALEEIGNLTLKGLAQPVAAFNIAAQ
jgi:class 3 adenylate cyclase